MKDAKQDTAIALLTETGLVTTNPRVQLIARKLRWNPGTLIAKIQAALPTVVEQHLYLSIARDTPTSIRGLSKLSCWFFSRQNSRG